MERILGIDLGTTNSVVSYMEQGQPVVIQNADGSRTTPSMVLYKSPEEIVVGELAKRQAVSYPKNTIKSVKRFMGARFSEIGPLLEGITYDIVEGDEDSILIDVGWTQVTPEEVSAEILKKMKQTAEEFFGEKVTRAVVTVPAYFNDSQRSSTKRAGELAELTVVRIINEPTAAALAYGIDKSSRQRMAVFDLGGGTFDISVLEIDRDVFEVRSTRGDTFLGGDTFDHSLVSHLINQFKNDTGIDLQKDPQAFQRVKEAAETAKCELSATQDTTVSLPFIAMSDEGPQHLQSALKRSDLEEMVKLHCEELLLCCEEAVRDSGFSIDEIDNVILAGGSTRIPFIQNLVKTYFKKEPIKSINPDEAIAIGAAIQGAILSGSLREILLLDVTPLSLGIELAGGIFSTLIQRNSSIPTAHTRTFTTVRDNQPTVKVHVLQGERKIAAENHSLGLFKLNGITPAPKEIPAIHVTFQIDANGILHVQAMDVTSGMSNNISIESYTSLASSKAEEAISNAENAGDEDKHFIRRQFISKKAEHILILANKAVADKEFPLPSELFRQIKESSFKLDVALAGNNSEEIERNYLILNELSSELEGHTMMSKSRRGQGVIDLGDLANMTDFD